LGDLSLCRQQTVAIVGSQTPSRVVVRLPCPPWLPVDANALWHVNIMPHLLFSQQEKIY
jgi:hypothetical protein